MKPKVVIGLMLLGFIAISHLILRSQFEWLILTFSVLFIGYLFLLKHFDFSVKNVFIVGILFRLCFLFNTPTLSDDFFRFIYDGRIVASGNNPYLILPNNLSENQTVLINKNELAPEVYEGLNSKQYYSVYPPINQLFFAAATVLANYNLTLEVLFMRLLIIGFELGTFYLMFKLLKHYKQSPRKVLIYAFNPLVIVELTGNLHFEGIVLFFGLLAVWLWTTKRYFFSPLAFSLAVGVKLIPLILLPILLRRLNLAHAILYGAVVIGLLGVYFFPFMNEELVLNFSSSIDLYFRSFEFNASIFYLVRAVGFYWVDYDIIQQAGPVLSILVLGLILGISLQKKYFNQSIFEKALIIVTIYFLFATTVHPWYITTLVGISVFVNYRYALFWSYLVFLSYSHYWNNSFEENYALIGAEYIILFILIILDFKQTKLPPNRNEISLL